LLSIGTMNTILVDPRMLFRGGIIAAAVSIMLMHPNSEPQPSESDIRATREPAQAGHLLKIEVFDHVIGNPEYCSLRALGYLS
jgi:DNA repair protein RadC